MVVYWFFFPPMSKALKDIGLLPLGTFGRRAQGHRHQVTGIIRHPTSGPPPVHRLRQTWLLMIFFFFLPWLLILIPLYTHEEVDWYKDLCTCTEFTRCWDWAVKSRGRSTTSTRQIPIWILE